MSLFMVFPLESLITIYPNRAARNPKSLKLSTHEIPEFPVIVGEVFFNVKKKLFHELCYLIIFLILVKVFCHEGKIIKNILINQRKIYFIAEIQPSSPSFICM